MVHLSDTLKNVVGGRTATVLADMGIVSVSDLVHYYPRDHKDSNLSDLRDLRVGEHATVFAEVKSNTIRPMGQRPGSICKVLLTDGRNELSLTFFNSAKLKSWDHGLKPGMRGLFSGDVGMFRNELQMTHPDFELTAPLIDVTKVAPLLPIYPATKDMRSWVIRATVKLVLEQLVIEEDALPEGLRQRRSLIELAAALRGIHTPQSRAEISQAEARLRWDEAFALQVVLAQRRARAAQVTTTTRSRVADGLFDAFMDQLPFSLTDGQVEVLEALRSDLEGGHPMHRLLQGEVGSGKTVVALLAMLAVIDAGGQAVLLAPTEVLAQQHHRSITTMLGKLAEAGMLGGAEISTRVGLLTGSSNAKSRRETLLATQVGEIGILVGTHALFEDNVGFLDLALVVVDEQHRFGVRQRDVLRSKGATPPHVLVMTATPIPRTVAMTVFGDLEVSTLTELPAGRKEISTHVVPATNPQWVERMWARVREEASHGHQSFVVFPRIGGEEPDVDSGGNESEEEGVPPRPPLGLLDMEDELRAGPLRGLRVGVLHGRMHADDKDAVMQSFARAELDVILSTTVIEVGVDVPNATVMVILDAERFGISQLHQLRGRIGRGGHAGWCLLHTQVSPASRPGQRLEAVAATTDGFVLAQTDLELRREGDVLGARQSGRTSRLKLLSLARDAELIREARDEAIALVAADPSLECHPAVAREVASLVDEEAGDFLERG